MHIRDLVEVAAVVAHNGPLIILSGSSLQPAPLQQYWSTSKSRCESWNRTLKYHAQLSSRSTDDWTDLRATLDEIFVGEILTRVWTAVLAARDRRQGTSVDEPLARSVFDSHMEARRRALELLLHSQAFSTRQAVGVNRLRRRADRWSDLLVGGMLGEEDVSEFAVDADRAAEFADDLASRQALGGGRQVWRLTLVSLRAAFLRGLCPLPANPDANARIAASILGCFPGELFDSTGVLHSLWMMRMLAVAGDAQGLIDDLLTSEPVRPDAALGRRRL